MKVIEKGKLFGKLNIIDLIVIIFILAAVVAVGMKLVGGSNEGTVSSTTKLTYTVRVTGRSAQVAEQLAEYVDAAAGKRDQLMASGEMLDAYIVDYWTEPTQYNRLSTGSMEVCDPAGMEAAGLVDICFVIEANVSNTLTNEVGTQEVRLGKTHVVKTTHLEFDGGIIESCAWG